VKKTVVFVTHDIDEAIKMGNRIAILREGGVLAQYDTPREILMHPADDFVAQFVGEDRGLKRLALITLGELKLIEPDAAPGEPRYNGALRLPQDTPVRSALSLMLTAGGAPVAVLDGDGQAKGLVTLRRGRRSPARGPRGGTVGSGSAEPGGGAVMAVGPGSIFTGVMAAGEPVIPNYGAQSSSCVVHNRFFCTDWVASNWNTVLWPALRGHILLALVAVAIGFVLSLALALTAHRYGWLERPTIVITTILYTIPSLALFELLVAPVGPNVFSAEIALVSYTLLILFRNILTGLRGVPAEVLEAAEGMGMSRRQALLRVELPLALPAIVAGLRIAVVTIIALATIVYTIYDAGLGVPIHTALGEGPFKTELIAAGGLAILLALTADALLVLLQRLLTPWTRARAA
jgi:osmoprotectant transport system permease protein